MSENDFIDRLAELRYLREVSSRRMSLSLGHEPDYIYSIEYGNYLPTMKEFFEICDYLDVTPMEFFDYHDIFAQEHNELIKEHTKTKLENTEIVNSLNELKNAINDIKKEINDYKSTELQEM